MLDSLIKASLLLMTFPVAGSALAVAANDPEYSISGNVAITSDYMFRGISQTWGSPALQGGGDLTMKNGFAAGFWASGISRNSYPGCAMELDLYASYGANFNDAWSWRAGLYGYVYPGGSLDKSRPPLPSRSFNTVEANAALTWKWLTLKYNRSLTDYFAIDTAQGYRSDSRGTRYIQLDAALPIDDRWSIALHGAHTDVPTALVAPLPGGATDPSYNDLAATLKWQFHPNWSASAGATYASNDAFYRHTASFRNPSDTSDVGGTRGFLMLQATF